MKNVFDGAATLLGNTLLYGSLTFAAFAAAALAFVLLARRRRWLDCAPLAGRWAGALLATAWVLGTLVVGAIVAPQVGAVAAATESLDDVATTLIAEGLVSVGAPLGIAQRDAPIDLSRYAALADGLVAQAAPADGASGWDARFWTLAADGVRAAIRHYAGTARVTPDAVAAWAWTKSARPTLRGFARDAIVADAVFAVAALAALAALVLALAWSARRAGGSRAPRDAVAEH